MDLLPASWGGGPGEEAGVDVNAFLDELQEARQEVDEDHDDSEWHFYVWLRGGTWLAETEARLRKERM